MGVKKPLQENIGNSVRGEEKLVTVKGSTKIQRHYLFRIGKRVSIQLECSSRNVSAVGNLKEVTSDQSVWLQQTCHIQSHFFCTF